MVCRGYSVNIVLAIMMNPIVLRWRMVMDRSGSASRVPVSRSTRCSAAVCEIPTDRPEAGFG